MIIGVGFFEVEPAERDEFIASRVSSMRRSRDEPGCLEYTFAADPLEPGRVVLVEKWESQAALDAHLAGLRDAPRPPATITPKAASLVMYETGAETKLI